MLVVRGAVPGPNPGRRLAFSAPHKYHISGADAGNVSPRVTQKTEAGCGFHCALVQPGVAVRARPAPKVSGSRPAGSIRAEIYGKGGAGLDRDCLVLWPAQKVGAVWDDAGVRERPDVGEVGGSISAPPARTRPRQPRPGRVIR